MQSKPQSMPGSSFIMLCLILLGLLAGAVQAQTTLILQPDATTGQDARLNNLYDYPMYERAELPASTWKWNAVPGIDRSVIRFDLSSIAGNARIDKAILHLFSNSDLPSGAHSTLGGANTFSVLRVVSPWDEHSVRWSAQPAVSLFHQVTVPGSTATVQNFAIDVTQLVRDMHADPANSYGFMIKLASELFDPCVNGIGYRRANFASSNHANPALHPKLVVTWSGATAAESPVSGVQLPGLYPNPTDGLVALHVPGGAKPCEVTVFDVFGRMIAPNQVSFGSNLVDLTGQQSGVYIFRLRVGDIERTVKVILR